MTHATPSESAPGVPGGLAARFWSLARGMESASKNGNPVACVRHVLAVLAALDRGETGRDLSVNTVSFLALLRESQQRGEVNYSSPEQLRGESMDERSLVFSVGVLLFERLTGRHPFGAEQNQARQLARIKKGEMGSGVNYFPNVPARLRNVLMRAMGPFPEERYRSLGELCRELHQFLDEQDQAGPRLPGTMARQLNRTAQGNVSFGQASEPESSSPEERAEGIARRRRERLSEMHLQTIGRHRLDTSPIRDRDATPAVEDENSREDHRPAMAVLPMGPTGAPAPAEKAAVPPTPAPVANEPASAVSEPIIVNERISGSVGAVDMSPGERTGKAKPGSVWSRVAYLGVGAAIAAAAMMFMAGGDGESKQNSAQTPAASAASAAPAASAPAPVAKPTPAPASTPERTPAVAAVPAEFAPESVTDQAAGRVVECFAKSRLDTGVRFRAGLRFAASESGVNKVYFSTAEELDNAEKSCVRDHLMGLSAGAAPESATVVNFQFRISGSSATATVK